MTSLLVEDVDDALREALRTAADRHGRTVGEEAREILRIAVLGTPASPEVGGGFGTRFASYFAGVGLEQDVPEWRGREATPAEFE